MNRTELIDAVSGDTGLTRQQSEAAIDAIVYEITSGVRSGSPVRITGFGTFKLRERQARRGRNPQTGEPVRIKASKGIGFTPGVKLKADLNSRSAPAKPKSIGTPSAAPAKRATTARVAPAKATTARAAAVKKAPAKTVAKAPAKTVAKAPAKAAPAAATRATAKKAATKTTATKRAAKR